MLVSRILQLLIEGSSPSSATMDSVNELRKLLSRSKGPLPKEEEIIGLTGELIFLFSLVEQKQNLWKGWNGPFKASKDYTLSNIDVELKASLQSGEPSITVSKSSFFRVRLLSSLKWIGISFTKIVFIINLIESYYNKINLTFVKI